MNFVAAFKALRYPRAKVSAGGRGRSLPEGIVSNIWIADPGVSIGSGNTGPASSGVHRESCLMFRLPGITHSLDHRWAKRRFSSWAAGPRILTPVSWLGPRCDLYRLGSTRP